MQKHKGNIAEMAVAYTLSKLNLPVFKEIGDSCSVDLITIVNKRATTIQVKYAEINENGSVAFSLRKTGPNNYQYFYKIDDFDICALYVADTEQVIWISLKEALEFNKICIAFRVRKAVNNQTSKTRVAENYLDFYKALCSASLNG